MLGLKEKVEGLKLSGVESFMSSVSNNFFSDGNLLSLTGCSGSSRIKGIVRRGEVSSTSNSQSLFFNGSEG